MTSGRRGLQLWKCLYLARNVTKGNNVLSQSTLMDLPTLVLCRPWPERPQPTRQRYPWLPGASDHCPALLETCHSHPHPTPGTHTLTSDLAIESHRLSASQTCVISCRVVRFDTKELHLKFTFYALNTAVELNVSWGHASVMWVEPSFTAMPLVVATTWPHIDSIGYWSGMVKGGSGWEGLMMDNCNNLTNICVSTHREIAHTLLLFIWILGPPTFLLRRLIVAGCVALHMRGKHNSHYLCKPFLNTFRDLQRHACIYIETYFWYPRRTKWIQLIQIRPII